MAASQASSFVIELRLAQAEDEAFLFRIFAESQQAFVATLADQTLGRALVEMQYRGRQMTYVTQFPRAEDLILLGADGVPIGRLLLDRNAADEPKPWRIVDIAVLAAHRSRGWGTRMIEECQRQCAAAGAKLELQVTPGNPARQLYERLGFRVTSEDADAVKMFWNGSGLDKRDDGIE